MPHIWTRRSLAVVLTLAALGLAGCAPSPNPMAGGGATAGFWMGLWHGFICCFTFVLSIFRDDVAMYQVRNSGGWYDLGFLLGASASLGGAGRAAGARNRR